jgi:DNA-directed RNA polymerase specialized sigma24 family protein
VGIEGFRDRHAREDVFQDVAVALWEQFSRYDPRRHPDEALARLAAMEASTRP